MEADCDRDASLLSVKNFRNQGLRYLYWELLVLSESVSKWYCARSFFLFLGIPSIILERNMLPVNRVGEFLIFFVFTNQVLSVFGAVCFLCALTRGKRCDKPQLKLWAVKYSYCIVILSEYHFLCRNSS